MNVQQRNPRYLLSAGRYLSTKFGSAKRDRLLGDALAALLCRCSGSKTDALAISLWQVAGKGLRGISMLSGAWSLAFDGPKCSWNNRLDTKE